MATNGLSTTFGGVEGEGWIKFNLPATASSARALPDQFNEECFVQVVVKQGNGWLITEFYNPGGTTVAERLRPGGINTANVAGDGNNPHIAAVLSTGTVNTNHTVYFFKNATTGKCDIRQTASSTLTTADVWVRKIG
jgi:hypothetical protein